MIILKIILYITGFIGFGMAIDDNEDTANWGWAIIIVSLIGLCFAYGWREYPDDAILH